jgi:hypothetical protein
VELMRRLHEMNDASGLILNFGPHKGDTLAQVAIHDPDYVRQLVIRAQRPEVRAAAGRLVDAIDAAAEHRKRTSRSSSRRSRASLVDRERYLVVPAEDLETLGDRCASLEVSMRRIGLPLERISDPRDALSAFLTPRPHGLGPAVLDISASDRVVADGEHVRAFDLGKLPATIVTDWAAPLFDGDLPLDLSIDIEPLDLSWAKLQLDTRRNALESWGLGSNGTENRSKA